MKINEFIKEGNTVDLKGPQGNAYYLLGIAKKLSKDLNLDWNKVEKEMTSCNYDNLVYLRVSHLILILLPANK